MGFALSSFHEGVAGLILTHIVLSNPKETFNQMFELVLQNILADVGITGRGCGDEDYYLIYCIQLSDSGKCYVLINFEKFLYSTRWAYGLSKSPME